VSPSVAFDSGFFLRMPLFRRPDAAMHPMHSYFQSPFWCCSSTPFFPLIMCLFTVWAKSNCQSAGKFPHALHLRPVLIIFVALVHPAGRSLRRSHAEPYIVACNFLPFFFCCLNLPPDTSTHLTFLMMTHRVGPLLSLFFGNQIFTPLTMSRRGTIPSFF